MYTHMYVCECMRTDEKIGTCCYVYIRMYALHVRWVGLRMYSMHVCMHMSVIHPHVHVHVHTHCTYFSR